MDHRQLTTFQAVAQTRSISRAAAELGYSQSAVTAQVKGLESALRVQLFERRRDGVRLTAFGERFLPYAERILGMAEQAREALQGDHPLSGTLVVGAGESIVTYRLPPLVESLHHRHPDVRLLPRTFQDGFTASLRALEQSEVDIVLLSSVTPPPTGVRHADLGDDDVALVATPDHPLCRRTLIDSADLAKARFLISQPDCAYARLLAAEIGEPHQPPLQFGTLEGVKKAVAGGFGVGLLPTLMVADLVGDGVVAALPWRPRTAPRLYAAWAGRHHGRTEIDALVAMLSRLTGEDLRLVG
jgi:DNA-binding transcriptional LysR family regulator